MDWNFEYKYRILGTPVKTNSEKLLLFDLNSAEIICSAQKRKGTTASSPVTLFPEEWRENFGLSVEEHSKLTRINIFEDYSVLAINE